MRQAGMTQEIKVKTVERTLMLLEVLAEQNIPLSLTKISRLGKLSISTTYRLLNTLNRNGFVERDKTTGFYKLGLKAFLIGNAALKSMELRQIALPYLNHLSQSIHESVYLGILTNQNVIYSDCVKTSGPIQIGVQTGVPLPAYQTSSGRLLLAFLTSTERNELIELFYKDRLIPDRDLFLEELEQIKTQGYAAGSNETMGQIREISVPVFNYLKNCTGSISIFKPITQSQLTESDRKSLDTMKDTGYSLSQALGFH